MRSSSQSTVFLSTLASALFQIVSPVRSGNALPQDIQWDELVRVAEWHGLAPLVHDRLGTRLALLPDAEQQRLRQLHTENAVHAMFFENELEQVMSTFRGAEIPLVPFKGIPLAKELYGDGSLRPTVDLDVMVREEDLERSRDLLVAAGWTWRSQWHIHYDFEKTVGGATVLLELHWTTQREGEYHLPGERFWDEAREEREGWRFSREITLLILVLHAARHHFFPFRQLVDIAHAVTQWNDSLDWDRVMALAQEAGAVPMLATVLALVRRDLGSPTPDHEPLARQMNRRRVRIAQRYLSPAHLLGKRWFPVLDRYLVPVVSGAWQPATLLLGDLVRSPEQIAYIYDLDPRSRLIPLFYLLRPFLLARKYLLHLLGLRRRPVSRDLSGQKRE